MLRKNALNTGLTALAISMAAAYSPAGSAAVVSYFGDFEAADINSPSALGPFGENFRYFVDVWGTGAPDASVGPPSLKLYDYSGAAPNASAGQGDQLSGIATGEGGPDQGLQYLNVFSDYNNGDQVPGGSCGANAGCTINTNIFQESTIDAGDIGSTWTLSFDAKSPFAGGIFDALEDNGGDINNPQSASAFIKTLDPNAGYATTNDIRVDMTNISNTDWATFSISIDLTDLLLNGQLIQFGFNNVSSLYDNSGVYYDNICFGAGDTCTVSAIPVPAAVWLFGSGLLGLVGVARRRKG